MLDGGGALLTLFLWVEITNELLKWWCSKLQHCMPSKAIAKIPLLKTVCVSLEWVTQLLIWPNALHFCKRTSLLIWWEKSNQVCLTSQCCHKVCKTSCNTMWVQKGIDFILTVEGNFCSPCMLRRHSFSSIPSIKIITLYQTFWWNVVNFLLLLLSNVILFLNFIIYPCC